MAGPLPGQDRQLQVHQRGDPAQQGGAEEPEQQPQAAVAAAVGEAADGAGAAAAAEHGGPHSRLCAQRLREPHPLPGIERCSFNQGMFGTNVKL